MYKRLGRGITNARQLTKVGTDLFGKDYLGTYPQDILPQRVKLKMNTPAYYVINTDRSGRKGQHWLGVYWNGSKNFIYDSFGRPSAKLVPTFIKKIGYKFADADKDAEQKVKENSCGARAMAWLVHVRKHGIRDAMKI